MVTTPDKPHRLRLSVSLPGPRDRRDHIVRVRLTRAEKEQLRADAARLGCGMSTLLFSLYRGARDQIEAAS